MTSPEQRDASRPVMVVGVDGSPGARAALGYALAAAASRGAELQVVAGCAPQLYWTAGAPVVVPDVPAMREATLQRALEAVESARHSVPEAADVPVEVCVTVEPAAVELVRRSSRADLVVVGSRGHGAVRSALLGSVALHVSTHAACPVVVHPATRPSAGHTGSPRVVVGVDGSSTGRAGLAAAVEEAVRLRAELDVVACFTVEPYWADLWQVVVPSADEVREDVLREAQAQVAAVLAARPAEAPAPRVHVEVAQGAPADVLVQRARDAALLVVGSRGHGAVRAALLGSVALHCVMHAPCPVLVVHPEQTGAAEAALSGAGRG